jgi:hypothetical protein
LLYKIHQLLLNRKTINKYIILKKLYIIIHKFIFQI